MPDEYQRWKRVDLWWDKRRMLLPSTGRWQAWLKPLEFWCSKGTWGLLCFFYFQSFWLDVYFPVCASKQAVKISISFWYIHINWRIFLHLTGLLDHLSQSGGNSPKYLTFPCLFTFLGYCYRSVSVTMQGFYYFFFFLDRTRPYQLVIKWLIWLHTIFFFIFLETQQTEGACLYAKICLKSMRIYDISWQFKPVGLLFIVRNWGSYKHCDPQTYCYRRRGEYFSRGQNFSKRSLHFQI